MTDKEIIEGNRLIAEFMGKFWWQAFKKSFYKPLWSDRYASKEECQEAIDKYFSGIKHDYSPKLCFDNEYYQSWNELMPVWKKFYKEIILTEWYQDNATDESNELLDKMEYNLVSELDIECAFYNLVEFIKWYNNQIKQP